MSYASKIDPKTTLSGPGPYYPHTIDYRSLAIGWSQTFFRRVRISDFLGIKPEINHFLKRTYWLSLCCIDWLTVEAQSLLVFLLWLRRSSSFILTILTNDLLLVQRGIYNLWIYVITEDGHKDLIHTVKLNYC